MENALLLPDCSPHAIFLVFRMLPLEFILVLENLKFHYLQENFKVTKKSLKKCSKMKIENSSKWGTI